jgi:hypothetical protein
MLVVRLYVPPLRILIFDSPAAGRTQLGLYSWPLFVSSLGPSRVYVWMLSLGVDALPMCG